MHKLNYKILDISQNSFLYKARLKVVYKNPSRKILRFKDISWNVCLHRKIEHRRYPRK